MVANGSLAATLLLLATIIGLLSSQEVSASSSAPRIDIRIPVYQQQYIEVQVGRPGKVLKLRIRSDLNDSYLYNDPSQYSNTFGVNSELFYLSQEVAPIRLRVVWGQEPAALSRRTTNGGVSFDGVLGLGPSSQIWRYWQKRTYSKFTLTFGNDDRIDALHNGDAASTPSGTFLASVDMPGLSFTIPMTIHIEDEYTYVPLALFSNISDAIAKGKRIPVKVYSDTDATALTLWLSTETSVITNSYGKPENSIRLSERYGKNSSEIQVGRIQLLDDFVYYEDKINGTYVVREVFDTYPSVPHNESPQAWLALIALLVWSLWILVMTPSLYMWLWYGMVPGFRTVRTRFRKLSEDVGWLERSKGREREAVGDEQAPIRMADSTGIFTQRIDRGPLDWAIVTPLLFLVRTVCLGSFYVATWGYHSHRFAARLAKLGRIPSLSGDLIYWALAGYMVVAPFIVNGYFMRKYAHLGSSMVTVALLVAAWINQLPDTTSIFFSLAVSLLISSLAPVKAIEYISWLKLVGFDSALYTNIINSREFGMPSGTLHATVHAWVRDFRAKHLSLTDDTFVGGETFMVILWIICVAPLMVAWMIMLNFLPALEYSVPRSPVKVWLCIVYGSLVICLASSRALGQFYRIHEDALIEVREEVVEIVAKAAK